MRYVSALLGCGSALALVASCGSSHNTGSGASHSGGHTGGASTATSNGGATAHGGASSAGGSGSGSANGGSTGALMLDSGSDTGNMCPAYKSCADQKFNCGKAPDGCGDILDCGTCSNASDTCTANVCTAMSCTKMTCASQGATCGMALDGCGGTLQCGTCPTGQTCAGTPPTCQMGPCMATTCSAMNWTCGAQSDGCGGVLQCGSCGNNQVCNGGTCQTVMCTPQTCAQQGFNCGSATDMCGNVIDCGTCSSTQICGGGGPNICGGNTGCPAGSELVYVWDLANVIHSFDPPSKTFTMIAMPDCDAMSPNSMAIDRNLVAWLNYQVPGTTYPNDYIYKFDLKTKTGCVGSGINIPPGYTQVGMGFSTDTPGGTTETLYVDGIVGGGLAKVDMVGNTIVPIGTFSSDPKLSGKSCELTGTGSAQLFGYFTTNPVRVAELNKTNSNPISDVALKNFPPPQDWAFSYWGGDFFLYAYPIPANNSPYSSVVHYAPSTGAVDLAYVPDVGFTIIGAGVSTCAPTTPCVPRTCAQANAACGPAGDGCGNIIMCGSCATGEACVAGACTAGCTPKTCSGQGYTCGMQGDGCGKALSCGACPSGESCNAGTCSSGTCSPKTCTQLGYMCGAVGDGCGNIINCGTCPAGEVCGGMTPGQCYKPPCTPKSCAQLGFNCGQATDGCGTIINCGTCSGGQTCGGGGTANVCGSIGM